MAGEPAEVALGEVDQLLVVDIAGRRDDHLRSAIMRAEKTLQVIGCVRADRFRRSEHGAANRLAGKRGLLEELEHPVLRHVVRGADLLQDHVLLERQLLRVEQRIADDVAEHVEAERQVALQEPQIVGRVVDAGLGVHLTADRLDRLGDVAGAAPLGALEGHVLEEMRDAVLARLFVARAGADPEPERHAFEVRHVVRGDVDAVREPRDLDAHQPTAS